MPRGHYVHSAASRAAQSARQTGKPHTHKGHPESAATRAKISAALTGKHHAAGAHHQTYRPGNVQHH